MLTLCFGHGASAYSTSKFDCACQSAYHKMTLPQRLRAGLHCVHYKVPYNFIPLEERQSVVMGKNRFNYFADLHPKLQLPKIKFCMYSINITRRHQGHYPYYVLPQVHNPLNKGFEVN